MNVYCKEITHFQNQNENRYMWLDYDGDDKQDKDGSF